MSATDTPKSRINYEPAIHRGKAVIFIRFGNEKRLNERVKKLVGVRWSATKKAWYVPDLPTYQHRFGLNLVLAGKDVLSQIAPVNQPALQRYVETIQLKAYSESTLRTYRNEFAQLLYILKDVPVDTLDPERLRSYFLYCTNTLKLSENTLHSRINAVKFYFEQVLHHERFFIDIPRPKKSLFCPK